MSRALAFSGQPGIYVRVHGPGAPALRQWPTQPAVGDPVLVGDGLVVVKAIQAAARRRRVIPDPGAVVPEAVR